jgi:hypothetical protein
MDKVHKHSNAKCNTPLSEYFRILRYKTLHFSNPAGAAADNISNNNSIQFFIYLRAELNSQWPITESARIQTTATRQHGTKQTNTKKKTKKYGSAKDF